VQRAENQVAGLGCFDGDGHGLQIPHLAYQDNVGVLSERGAQGVFERARVQTDLALGHQTLLALVDELDGIFNGDDVIGASPVDEIHQCRQRGALAAPGWPGHHHESLGEIAEILDFPAQAHLVRGADGGGNYPEHP
jgi:hypothetical protein